MLFDEPLSNLDAVLREQMRFEIRSLQQRLGITAIYVTHSQDEALVLSDRIGVMQDGLIVQLGSPLDIYHVPKNAFVANFIGLANILDATAVERPGQALRLASRSTAERRSLRAAAPSRVRAIAFRYRSVRPTSG